MPIWTGPNNGQWGATGNWDTGVVPNAIGAVATFTANAANRDVFLGGNTYTIGTINFNNTVAGGGWRLRNGTIIFEDVDGEATVNVDTSSLIPDFGPSTTLQLNSDLFYKAFFVTSTIAGAVTGAGKLYIQASSGVVTLAGPATHTGLTTVSAGTLSIDGNYKLSAASEVNMLIGGLLDLQASDQRIAGLLGAGGTVLSTGGQSLLIIDTPTGFVENFYGNITGSIALQKEGPGVQAFWGTNTFSDGVRLFGGELIAQNAAAIGTGRIEIEADSTLELNGTTFANEIIFYASATLHASATLTGQFGILPNLTLRLAGNTVFSASSVSAQNGTLFLDGGLSQGTKLTAGNSQLNVLLNAMTGGFTMAPLTELDMNGFDQTVHGLTGSGTIDFGTNLSTNAVTLTVNNAGTGFTGSLDGRTGAQTPIVDNAVFNGSTVDLSLVQFAQGGWLSVGEGFGPEFDTITINGTANGDNLTGSRKGDVLFGLGGGDVLSGGASQDALNGDAGNDFLTGGAGNDTLNGGTDFDYANYLDASTTAGITLSLAVTTAQVTGGAGTDTLTSIEGIYGSNFGDTLTGDNAAVNALYGWGGADSLSGGGGFDYVEAGEADDTMDGGAGDDYLLGGNGIDTLTFATAGAAVYVDMSGASAFANGTASGFDVLSSVERVIGSGFGDFLFGSAGADTLSGGVGIDIIYGFGLGDSLDGGADTDYLVGGAGADTITSGAGQDYIYFQGQNEGKDTITDWRANGFDILCIDEPAFGGGLTINQYLSDAGNANRFVAGTAATAAIGQFLWNSATSTLSWDADGTGVGVAVQLVTLTGITSLTASDVLVL
jgi:autotransporter-associated beta strand protein